MTKRLSFIILLSIESGAATVSGSLPTTDAPTSATSAPPAVASVPQTFFGKFGDESFANATEPLHLINILFISKHKGAN